MDEVSATEPWQRYGRALIAAMTEVLEEVDEGRELMLEVADYWLTLGLVIGLEHGDDATRLLELIEADPEERRELHEDADEFVAEALT